jgi:N-acetyl-anhydromuramyl-L-alanine amidase AmpD
MAWHASTSVEERRHYIQGTWKDQAAYKHWAVVDAYNQNKIPQLVRWWQERWPGKMSPQHLYPGKSPNASYVGVELVPCLPTDIAIKGFTVAQYAKLAKLAVGIATRHKFPDAWYNTARLAGHEDVNPMTRPGWDPGDYVGKFSWPTLIELIKAEIAGL